MKQRFSSLDVKVIAHELQQSLVTLRLANVYDLSSKILLVKFAKPNSKQQLVIDIGFHCHLTDFARTTAAAPSAFVARLRKFLKTRRLTSVSQVGSDRILEFQFSDGQYRLFLEFFASGNIILTDAELKIIAIARNVAEGEGRQPQRVGSEYSLEATQNFTTIPPLTRERVRDALQLLTEKTASSAETSAKKPKGKPGADLRRGLAVSITELPPIVIEHSLKANNFDETTPISDILDKEALLDDLVQCLTEARDIVESVTSSALCKGYIFAKRKPGASSTSDDASTPAKRDDLLYEHFHPFVPQNFKEDPAIEVLEFEGYNRTVDEFFSSLEGQKLELRLLGREVAAERKLEAARRDQARRIEGLKDAQTMNARKAAAIEANVERVQEAMEAVNGLLAQGMDWVDVGKLVEREKKRGNPVAGIIHLPLKLSENIITLILAEEEFEDDEDDDESNPFGTDESESEDEATGPKAGDRDNQTAAKSLRVDVSLNLSPWSNAREYYDQKRTAAVKEEKTQLQVAKALKSTEHKITQDLKKGLKQEKALLQPIRRQMWFEKFTWFISSDGYLVLGGKDSQQHDIIYNRYLRKGDVYCHAELRGAPPVIIRNNSRTPDAPIPPATLAQAGSLCVCASEAWDSKAGMGAWWVNADQVTKLAPTGDVLPTGSFHVKGKKNFLAPTQLLLGFGVMFKISDESKMKRVKHRLKDEESTVRRGRDEAGKEEALESRLDDASSESESEEDRDVKKKRANPLQAFEGGDETMLDVEDELSQLQIAPPPEDQEALSISKYPEDEAENAGEEDDIKDGNGDNDDDSSEEHEGDQREADEDDGQDEKEGDGNDDEDGKDKNNDEEDRLEDSSTQVSKSSSATPSKPVASKKAAANKRGQKGKAKKMAQKYKHQDEEDKAAAEALIGATVGRQRAEAEAAAKAQRQAELEAAKERRRAQHLRKQKEVAEREEVRHAAMKTSKAEDEGGPVNDDEDHDDGDGDGDVDSLVGQPLPGDEILEILPVCAPWNAMARFKYKVKMQPGTVKKGKAIKEMLERWGAAAAKKGVVDESASDVEKIWPREIELIKTLKPEGVNNTVPVSKVKMMISGGASGGGGSKGKGNQKGQGKGKGGKK